MLGLARIGHHVPPGVEIGNVPLANRVEVVLVWGYAFEVVAVHQRKEEVQELHFAHLFQVQYEDS